jgi:large repetitive protein
MPKRDAILLGLLMLALPLLGACAGGNDSLPTIGTVQGTVLDDGTSLGIAGATVAVAGISATTSATGTFTVTRVPTGNQSYSITATGYQTVADQQINVRENQTTRIDARLSPTPADIGEVHGTVTDALTTAPIAGVAVTIGTQSTVTSSLGVYILTGVAAGDRTVTFRKATYVDRDETVTVVAGGKHELSVTLTPQTTGTIAGTVTDSVTTDPIAGVTVSIETLGSTTTGADGTYSLTDVPAGTWTVSYTRTSYRAAQKSVTVTISQTTVQDVAMSAPAEGTVEGQVRNQTSGGLQAGVHVTLTETERTTDTDANGYYKFTNVASGIYTVLFTLTDYGSLTRTGVEVECGETTVLDVELAPTVGGLVGWVFEKDPQTGLNGAPVADASVRIGNDLMTLTTDENGHYEAHDIPSLAAGTVYTIYAWSSTDDLAQVDVTVKAGKIVQAPDIGLSPAG